MKKLYCLLSFSILLKMGALAQSVTIGGMVPKPYTLTANTMQHMKHIELNAKAHDEKVHHYSGVLLSDILTEADVTMGEGSKKRTVTSYALISASDNYKILFALTELDPLFSSRTIILADQIDGKPLPASEGPFQVIVPGEKKYARWIRQVKEIKLVTVKE